MTYVGSSVTLTVEFTPTASSCTFRVRKPDGAESTSTSTPLGGGRFSTVVEFTQPGKWVIRFESSSPKAASEVEFAIEASAFATIGT